MVNEKTDKNIKYDAKSLENSRFFPPADVFEKDGIITVTLSLRETDMENISISFKDKLLLVKGESSEEEFIASDMVKKFSGDTGQFKRNIPILSPIDENRIETHINGQILKIKLHKKEEVMKN